VTEPEPAVVPVKVTEQLVTPDAVDKVHVSEIREPPVLPAVNVNVTVPVGELDGVVVSATVAVTAAEQLAAPRAMLQLAAGTVVVVGSRDETVTEIAAAALALPLWVVSPP